VLHLKPGVDAKKYDSVVSINDKIWKDLDKISAEDFDKFIEDYDIYTVFTYFHKIIKEWLIADTVELPPRAKVQGLIDSVLHYTEIAMAATGLNNLALVECVIDGRNFPSEGKWVTIKGGMEKLPKALADRLRPDTLKLGAQVTTLSQQKGSRKVEVGWVEGREKKSEIFDAVIVTAPFGAVRFLDIDIPFTYGKRQAIRSLNYDHATKIFAQFPERWWETHNHILGGVTDTDIPIRGVVYPSYGIGDKGKGVLLASYTWANDAIMWANTDEHLRKEAIVRDLEKLHKIKLNADEVKLKTHVWLEAYARFYPGQFQLMVNAMIPEHGVHFAGEHLSTYHAWIVGAMNTASRAIREISVLDNLLDGSFEEKTKESWQKFPDDEFDEGAWIEYMERLIGKPQ